MTSLKHFTHLSHQLTETCENNEFRCNGCERYGTGKRYQCKQCNFNLHFHCGHCPIDLLSFIHSKHQLALTFIQRAKRPSFSQQPACEVCGVNVGGLFYCCKRCDLYVHPLCAQLPQYVHHTDDKEHVLELQHFEQYQSCTVCGGQCSRWYYTCGTCPVSVHIGCLLEVFVASGNTPMVKKRSTFRRPTGIYLWLCIISFLLALVVYVVFPNKNGVTVAPGNVTNSESEVCL